MFYKHVKTGKNYHTIGTAIQESDLSLLVLYRGEFGPVWCRTADEFFDGRFERLDNRSYVYECYVSRHDNDEVEMHSFDMMIENGEIIMLENHSQFLQDRILKNYPTAIKLENIVSVRDGEDFEVSGFIDPYHKYLMTKYFKKERMWSIKS